MLIDSHCHVMPDALALAIRRFFDDRMGWGTLAYDGVLLDDVARAQRDAGTDRFWALPYAHKAGVAAQLNEWIASEAAPLAGVVAAATFHPDDEDLAALADRAFGDLGLRLAKLHCSVGKFDAGDPHLDPLWERAQERGVPIIVHVGREMSGHTYAPELAPVGRIAAAYPRLKLILAHCGSPGIDAALDLIERHSALYGDLTSAAQWKFPLPIERLEALHEKILFGSDCPNTTVTITESMAWLRRQGLSPRALQAILGENAARLIP
ncbi:MAG: amidohydrolase family protein [Deltaproteobacteria bacterium]|nr:amidohydrolase family protein [Deltaproteobacteria bacterium]